MPKNHSQVFLQERFTEVSIKRIPDGGLHYRGSEAKFFYQFPDIAKPANSGY